MVARRLPQPPEQVRQPLGGVAVRPVPVKAEGAETTASHSRPACPVTAACLAYGLQVDPDPAIYGGLTEAERRGLRAPRTTCKRGHEFTPENTYRTASRPTARWCRACKANRDRRYRRASRQAVSA